MIAADPLPDALERLFNLANWYSALGSPPDEPFIMYLPVDGGQVSAAVIGDVIVVGKLPVGETGNILLKLFGDRHLSHTHFRIVRMGDSFRLVDLASTNGTFVNKSTGPISEHWLTSGDCIRAGDHLFIFVNP